MFRIGTIYGSSIKIHRLFLAFTLAFLGKHEECHEFSEETFVLLNMIDYVYLIENDAGIEDIERRIVEGAAKYDIF